MESRINIFELEPKAYDAMLAFETYLQASPLQKTHKELIKIRASQINGCAYCIDMHTKDAMKHGETAQRIFMLNAWRESNLFNEEEKAILALTEEVTRIHQSGVSDAAYQAAAKLFDKNYLALIILMVVAINGWNRVMVSVQGQAAN